MLHQILLVFGFVLCVVGAFYNPPKCSLGWLGIACFILTYII